MIIIIQRHQSLFDRPMKKYDISDRRTIVR